MSQTGTIGIVGGGQLGRMLTEAARAMGFRVVVIDPGINCPAKQVGAEQIVAALDDHAALQQLAQTSDVITIEIEHVNSSLLADIARLGTPVEPSPVSIKMIQDKLAQKQFLSEIGIPVADFVEITDKKSAEQAFKQFGGAMILKTRRGAYDGRGNMVIHSSADIAEAFELFADQKLYAEKLIDFEKELAVMVARGKNGERVTYPVAETIQERNICVEVIVPAEIKEDASKAAQKTALTVAEHLEGAGVFGVELFLTTANEILVNEIAPRVHNSGHYTIEACATSQFAQHIRAIAGLPLGPTNLIVPAAVMVNILGKHNGPPNLSGLEAAHAIPDTQVYLYGKSPTKVDRKMGHITATGTSIPKAKERAEHARGLIDI